MKELFVIGDPDTPLALPSRLSESDRLGPEEKLWARISVDDPCRFMSAVNSRFGSSSRGSGAYYVNAQHLVEFAKSSLDDGELAGMAFSMTMYDWHVMGSVTVFSRTVRQD